MSKVRCCGAVTPTSKIGLRRALIPSVTNRTLTQTAKDRHTVHCLTVEYCIMRSINRLKYHVYHSDIQIR